MKRGPVILLGLALVSLPIAAEEQPPHLLARELYARGDYADCRGLVHRLIDDYVEGHIKVPVRDMATVYILAACLADVFRDTGYVEAVDEYLRIGIEMDPNVDLSLVESRAYVRDRFTAIRAGIIALQGPAGRRYSMGFVLGADGAGGIHWRNTLSIGLRLGVGIAPRLALEGSASIPLRSLPLDEGEICLGATFRPDFDLNRPIVVVNASYVATHQAAWTQGVSLSAGAEIVLRSGISFRASTELLRLQGTEAPDPDATDYPSIVLWGMPITFGFPRIVLAVAYAF